MATKTELKQLLAQVTKAEKAMRKIYGDTYQEVINMAEVRKAIEAGDSSFDFDKNKKALDQLNSKLEALSSATGVYLSNATTKAWKQGEKQASTTLAAMAGKKSKKMEEAMEDATDQARDDMRKRGATAGDWYNKKHGGISISDRVWKLNDTARGEIETIIQNGILEGKDADEISRSVRPYLNNPNSLFKHVKDKETGEYVWSEAAKKYHPGQGVYRSAYKNAMRLIRTEVNAAYRRAEWESYQSNPLVTGFHIALSNNHTTLNSKGQPVPLKDICDSMVGDYPKGFQWTGWHPQCRCTMTPILVDNSDFKTRLQAMKKGALEEWEPKRTVKEVPAGYDAWIEANKKRIMGAKRRPFWVTDNYKDGDVTKKLMLAVASSAQAVRKTSNNMTEDDVRKAESAFTWISGYINDREFMEACSHYGIDVTLLSDEANKSKSSKDYAMASSLKERVEMALDDLNEAIRKYKNIVSDAEVKVREHANEVRKWVGANGYTYFMMWCRDRLGKKYPLLADYQDAVDESFRMDESRMNAAKDRYNKAVSDAKAFISANGNDVDVSKLRSLLAQSPSQYRNNFGIALDIENELYSLQKSVTNKNGGSSKLVVWAKLNKVTSRSVDEWDTTPTTEEIVSRLAGGDMTKGSCSSLALAYAANKAGLNVLDFRGGSSRVFFSKYSNIKELVNTAGGKSLEGYDTISTALSLLSGMEKGKEYYLACARHAAIVRKAEDGTLQYLELQSKYADRNTFHTLDALSLHDRFGASVKTTVYGASVKTTVYLVEIGKLGADEHYRELMGYINTEPSKQKKGHSGGTK